MRTASTLAAAFVLLLSHGVLAATLLDFENLPAGTTVNDQYVRSGVRFSSAFLATDPAARSGTRVLRTVAPTAEVFNPVPLAMSFIRRQARVKLFAAASGAPGNGTLRAFDPSGAVIAQDGPKLVTVGRFTTMFEVTVPGLRIARAELRLDGTAHFAIDDLEFDNSQPVEPPLVNMIETRQPSAADNPMVTGKFPADFRIGAPPDVARRTASDTESEAAERFNLEWPSTVERDLAPGATAVLSTRVPGRAGFAGSVRWIGTAAALPVTLSMNGAPLATGKSYSLGDNRGGSDVGGKTESAGEARLSVTNTSDVRVKVRLNLGVVRGQSQ